MHVTDQNNKPNELNNYSLSSRNFQLSQEQQPNLVLLSEG